MAGPYTRQTAGEVILHTDVNELQVGIEEHDAEIASLQGLAVNHGTRITTLEAGGGGGGGGASNAVWVTDHGAVGDGLTANLTAFHAARDAAGVGGTVFVPDGTYLLGEFRPNVAGQTWELAPGATLKMANAANIGDWIAPQAADITIKGGEIDGNKAEQSSGLGRIIIGSDAQRFTIDGVYVHDIRGEGIRVYGGGTPVEDVTIKNCRVANTGDQGINVDGDAPRVAVLDNLVSGTGDQGIIVYNNSDHFIVRGNRINSPGGMGIECLYNDYGTVADNAVHDAGTMGISVGFGTGVAVTGNNVTYLSTGEAQIGIEVAASVYHCTVVGNTIDGLGNNTYGIQCSDGAAHVAITGNTIRRCALAGIHVYQCSDFAISGNIVADSASASAKGIYVQESENVTVTGNQITDYWRSIAIDEWQNISVTGNTCYGYTSSGLFLGTWNAGTYDRLVIADNVFQGTGSAFGNNFNTGADGGTSIKFANNVGIDDYTDWWNRVGTFVGTGTPEGSVTAGIGSTYRNRSGGASTTLYVKTSGTGSTGWTAK